MIRRFVDLPRILAVALFLAGFWCLGQQDYRARAQFIGEEVWKAVPSGAANNTALDGSVNANVGSASSLALPGLTTTAAGIVIVFAEINTTITGETVVGSSLGSFTRRAVSTVGGNNIAELFAISSGALTGEIITITPPSSVFIEGTAFGVKGVKTGTNNGYDINGALPAAGTTSPVSITTSNANDFLIVGSRNGGGSTPPTGFTNIVTGSFLMSAYKIVTTTQSALSVADPSGSSNGIIGDALVSN